MKEIITRLNKHFESRVRLGIMSILMVNEWVDFKTLKQMLNLTDGNLASHLNALERNQMIVFKKRFVGRKPNTSYGITTLGREAFSQHLDALESIVNAKYNDSVNKNL